LNWDSELAHTVQIQENKNLETKDQQMDTSSPDKTHQWGDRGNSQDNNPRHTL